MVKFIQLTILKINKKFIKKNYKLKEVKNIIKNFDIVINALPLTSVTKNFFNMKIFNEMKKNSYFINISRDQTINIRDFNIVIKKNLLELALIILDLLK